jgi:hypothetical protein
MTVIRKVYDIWAMFSYLGGIVCAFVTLGLVFIKPFAKVSFQFEAILSMFKVQQDSQRVKEVSFCDRLRQITCIFRSKLSNRLLERGVPKLAKQFDMVGILENIKQANISQTNVQKEIIDLNDDTDTADIPKMNVSP